MIRSMRPFCIRGKEISKMHPKGEKKCTREQPARNNPLYVKKHYVCVYLYICIYNDIY